MEQEMIRLLFFWRGRGNDILCRVVFSLRVRRNWNLTWWWVEVGQDRQASAKAKTRGKWIGMKETKLLTTAVESTGRTEWRDGRKRDELQLVRMRRVEVGSWS